MFCDEPLTPTSFCQGARGVRVGFYGRNAPLQQAVQSSICFSFVLMCRGVVRVCFGWWDGAKARLTIQNIAAQGVLPLPDANCKCAGLCMK